MAVRSSEILFVGGNFIIDRIQSGDVNPNITNETINEVGNTRAVGIIRDAPTQLTCTIESYDVTPKLEALILGLNPTSTDSLGTGSEVGAGLTAGQQLDFNNQVPLSIVSPIRSTIGTNATITGGVIIPNLALSQVQYRFGLRQDAQQTFTLNGDSMFYGPPNTVPYEDVFTGNGATKTWTLSGGRSASPYVDPASGNTQYVLNVVVYNTDGTYYTLFNGLTFDYVDTATSLTLNTTTAAPATGSLIRVNYFSGTGSESIPQSDNAADGVSVKPAAIRAWNIDIYFGNNAATPTWTRLRGVQSVDVTWQATGFEANDEFGNPRTVSHDYVVPAVDGTVTVRSDSVSLMMSNLASLLNVIPGDVIGMLSGTALQLLIVLKAPNGVTAMAPGQVIKTLYIPDAIFNPPQMTARAAQKIDLPFRFYSNSGELYTYNAYAGDLTGAYPWPS